MSGAVAALKRCYPFNGNVVSAADSAAVRSLPAFNAALYEATLHACKHPIHNSYTLCLFVTAMARVLQCASNNISRYERSVYILYPIYYYKLESSLVRAEPLILLFQNLEDLPLVRDCSFSLLIDREINLDRFHATRTMRFYLNI